MLTAKRKVFTKGLTCPFADREFTCLKTACKDCQVYLEAIEKANSNLCPFCGADNDVYLEMLGTDCGCGGDYGS